MSSTRGLNCSCQFDGKLGPYRVIFQLDPHWRMVAGIVDAADRAIHACGDEPPRGFFAQKQVVDAQPASRGQRLRP